MRVYVCVGSLSFPYTCTLLTVMSSRQQPMDDEEMLFKQVQMTTAATKGTTVWVYRNTVYGYPWYTDVRKTLEDPAYVPVWQVAVAGGNDSGSGSGGGRWQWQVTGGSGSGGGSDSGREGRTHT